MKNLFLKQFSAIIFAFFTLSIVRADDSSKEYQFFSHAIVNLPLEVKKEEPWSNVITTTRDWDLFYSDLLWDGASEPAELLTAPAIDFDSYQLLVGGLGLQMSGGFSLSIRKVIEYNDSLLVDVLIMKPGENCLVAMALTYPSVAVLIKKTTKPLQFVFTNLTVDCF